MGSPKVSIPGPSEEERALQAANAAALRRQEALLSEQMRQQELLAPILFKQSGIRPIYADGKIVGFEETPQLDPNRALREEIETGFLKRTQAALKGELPVDPALLSDLGEQEMTLRESLRKNLGPGFETSTPGIETLGKFGKRRSELLDAARRGDLTLAEQLGISRQGANELALRNLFERSAMAQGYPFQNAAQLSAIASGYGQAMDPYLQSRKMELMASAESAKHGSFGRTLSQSFAGSMGKGLGNVFNPTTWVAPYQLK